MVKAELPSDHVLHERTRFLAAAGLGTDLAATELYKSLTDEGRSEVAGMLAEVRSRVGKLKVANEARLAKGEETQEGG